MVNQSENIYSLKHERTLLIASLIIVSYLRQSRYPRNVIFVLSHFLVIRTSDVHRGCFFKKKKTCSVKDALQECTYCMTPITRTPEQTE